MMAERSNEVQVKTKAGKQSKKRMIKAINSKKPGISTDAINSAQHNLGPAKNESDDENLTKVQSSPALTLKERHSSLGAQSNSTLLMVNSGAVDGDQYLNKRFNRKMLHNNINNRLSLGQKLDNKNDRYIKVYEKYEEASKEKVLAPIE